MDMTNIEAIASQLPTAPLSQIADLIRRDWRNPFFAAVPYIRAMLACPSMDSQYGVESGGDIALYFLANAQTWRGPVAKAVKAELKRRLALQKGS